MISKHARAEISQFVIDKIGEVIQKHSEQKPFRGDEFAKESPFNASLVPGEVWKLSRFERSFVTSMGMSVYERIALLIGAEALGQAHRSRVTAGYLFQAQEAKIQQILTELQHPNRRSRRVPNWREERNEVVGETRGRKIEKSVVSDLWLSDEAETKQVFYEIKAPKPNADQTKESKDKLLTLVCIAANEGKNFEVFFALPYNPYPSVAEYAWPHPKRYFNMQENPPVQIGKDFWDYLAGKGTYEQLLALFAEIGRTTKELITKSLL